MKCPKCTTEVLKARNRRSLKNGKLVGGISCDCGRFWKRTGDHFSGAKGKIFVNGKIPVFIQNPA